MSYPGEIIYRDDTTEANCRATFLGFVKASMIFGNSDSGGLDPFAIDNQIERDIPRFLISTHHRQPIHQLLIMEGYFYNHLDRDGLMNALSCIQLRLLKEYIKGPESDALLRRTILDTSFCTELREYILSALHHITITQFVVNRAKEMLKFEADGNIVFPSDYRNYLLIIIGRSVVISENNYFRHGLYSVMEAVAHPQLTKEIFNVVGVDTIKSNIFYDLPNYFMASCYLVALASTSPNTRHKLHVLFATGKLGEARYSKVSDDLWNLLSR